MKCPYCKGSLVFTDETKVGDIVACSICPVEVQVSEILVRYSYDIINMESIGEQIERLVEDGQVEVEHIDLDALDKDLKRF